MTRFPRTVRGSLSATATTASGSGAGTPGRPTSSMGRSTSTGMANARSSQSGVAWSGRSGYNHTPAGITARTKPADGPSSATVSSPACQPGVGNRRPIAPSGPPPSAAAPTPKRRQPASANNMPPGTTTTHPAGATTSTPNRSATTAAATRPDPSSTPAPDIASRTNPTDGTTVDNASATTTQSAGLPTRPNTVTSPAATGNDRANATATSSTNPPTTATPAETHSSTEGPEPSDHTESSPLSTAHHPYASATAPSTGDPDHRWLLLVPVKGRDGVLPDGSLKVCVSGP